MLNIEIDPKLDLVLERTVDAAPELVWKAWTDPEHVVKWFTPRPWTTARCEIDLRPGGIFRTVMRSPEGVEHDNFGCYLEVVHNHRLVWTDALLPGFRPSASAFMTGMIILKPHGAGTHYTAVALHASEESRERHAEMGFHDGWSSALDQLLEVVRAF